MLDKNSRQKRPNKKKIGPKCPATICCGEQSCFVGLRIAYNFQITFTHTHLTYAIQAIKAVIVTGGRAVLEYNADFSVPLLEILSTQRSEVHEYFDLTNSNMLICIHFVSSGFVGSLNIELSVKLSI